MLDKKLHGLLSPTLVHRHGLRKFVAADAQLGCMPKAWTKCWRAARHLPRSYVSDSDSGDEDGAVDIDALARKLSQEAERLRRTESNKEASTSQPSSSNQYATDDPIFGQQVIDMNQLQ